MRFLVATHTQEQPYVCISSRIWSHHTHWHQGRSVPCVKAERRCPLCGPDTPTRWTGYLHVLTPENRIDTFLTLPPGAAYNLLQSLPEDYDLRGRKLYVKRDGKSRTSPLLLRLDPTFLASFNLPPEQPPAAFLELLFKKVEHLTNTPAA